MYEYIATIIKIIDGDTVDVQIDLGLRLYHETRIRLYGINAPELNTPAGQAAKLRLIQLLPIGSTITLQTHKDRREKYGRYLGTFIDSDSHDINQRMILEGHAVAYFP